MADANASRGVGAARIVALLDTLHRKSAQPHRANGQTSSRAGDTGSSRVPTLISLNRA